MDIDEMRYLFEGGHLYCDALGEIHERRRRAGQALVAEVERLRAVVAAQANAIAGLEDVLTEVERLREEVKEKDAIIDMLQLGEAR